ncbi:hypothetical protein ACFLT1_06205 [Bacteroidota bacterium]
MKIVFFDYYPRGSMAKTLGLLLSLTPLINAQNLKGQSLESTTIKEYKNSIEIGPMGDIYMLQYGHKLTPKDEIVLGGGYLNTAILDLIKYPGINKVFFLEAGYRRYLWRNLNAEFQIMPNYTSCNDTIEQKIYNGIGFTTEIRLGYRFEFNIKEMPFLIHLQWFAGYMIINPKPQSFVDVDGGSFYISPIPIILLGFRF